MRPVIGVARNHVISQGRDEMSIGIVLTSGDQPADIFLRVPLLNQGFNLVSKLETFGYVMPPSLWNLQYFAMFLLSIRALMGPGLRSRFLHSTYMRTCSLEVLSGV